jgi:hypothetical protein
VRKVRDCEEGERNGGGVWEERDRARGRGLG